MDKEQLKNKIDRQITANIDGLIDRAEEITSEVNNLIASIRYISYLHFLKDKIFEKEN